MINKPFNQYSNKRQVFDVENFDVEILILDDVPPHGPNSREGVVEPGDGEHVGDAGDPLALLPHHHRLSAIQQQLGRGQLSGAQLVFQFHHLQ